MKKMKETKEDLEKRFLVHLEITLKMLEVGIDEANLSPGHKIKDLMVYLWGVYKKMTGKSWDSLFNKVK